jgi:hypothetical protein
MEENYQFLKKASKLVLEKKRSIQSKKKKNTSFGLRSLKVLQSL